jgi:hypothetical protein
MPSAWDHLSEECQMQVAEAAMQRANEILARQADAMAEEIAQGDLPDRGGAEALRLFASLIRKAQLHWGHAAGHA